MSGRFLEFRRSLSWLAALTERLKRTRPSQDPVTSPASPKGESVSHTGTEFEGKLLDLYKERYYAEQARRYHLDSGFSVPITLVSAIGGGWFFLGKSAIGLSIGFPGKAAVELLLSAAFLVCIAISLANSIRSRREHGKRTVSTKVGWAIVALFLYFATLVTLYLIGLQIDGYVVLSCTFLGGVSLLFSIFNLGRSFWGYGGAYPVASTPLNLETWRGQLEKYQADYPEVKMSIEGRLTEHLLASFAECSSVMAAVNRDRHEALTWGKTFMLLSMTCLLVGASTLLVKEVSDPKKGQISGIMGTMAGPVGATK